MMAQIKQRLKQRQKNRSCNHRLLMLLYLCFAVCGTSYAQAQENRVSWHAAGWSYRAIVEVPKAADDMPEMDVAQVRIDHAGAMLANANDLRIYDLAGKAVPYLVTFQDARRYALISFKAPGEQGFVAIYFGNKGAAIDPMRATASPTTSDGTSSEPPVAGSAANGWLPRAGLVLATYARPGDIPSPQDMTQMSSLLTKSLQQPHGADYRANISDSTNPFGTSDNYVSVYRGWISLPESGQWGFCTTSSNASFSFIDGKKLVHWPGGHLYNNGSRGHYNATQTLNKGLHYITYFHEHHQHRAMAFLGIKPPGQKYFSGIGNAMFPEPRKAVVTKYQTSDFRTLAVPSIQIQDAVLFYGPPAATITRVRFGTQLPKDQLDQWQVTWETGDGQSIRGLTAEHLYLNTGRYKVTMIANGNQGQRLRIDWPLNVYPANHQPDDIETVRARTYGDLLDVADPHKYTGDQTLALAQALEQIDHHTQAIAAARVAVFKKDLSPASVSDMLDLAWQNAPASQSQSRQIVAHLKQRLEKATHDNDALSAMQLRASLIAITGVWLRDFPSAEALYPSAELISMNQKPSQQVKQAMRQTALAMGDACLFSHQIDKAREQYQLAKTLTHNIKAESVLAAHSGMYPQQIEDQLVSNSPERAWMVVSSWKDEVPLDRLTGLPWFYQGKVFLADKNPHAAIGPLVLAATLLRGSADEAQAYWLAAAAYRLAGEQEKSLATLRQLISTGLTGRWVDRARESLENNKP